MPKKIDDIVPTGKKSIRNIPVPIRKMDPERELSKSVDESRVDAGTPRVDHGNIRPEIRDLASRYSGNQSSAPASTPPSRPTYSPPKERSGSNRTWVYVVVGLIIFIGGFFAFSNGATISYMPKKISLAFTNDAYLAKQTAEAGELSYSTIKLSAQKESTAPASGEESVSEKAKGKVMIYNEQSAPQQLVKTTRLETPDGKIFRIEQDVNIPAKGSVEVTAVADVAGKEYNVGLSDFTIPGFKTYATKYKQVFARSKTPMAGGFVGMRSKVAEDKLAEVRSSLEQEIAKSLSAEASSKVPEGFILFQSLANITYEMMPIEKSGDSEAKIIVRGDLNAYIFKSTEFASYLVKQKNKTLDNILMSISDPSKLNISLTDTLVSASTSSIKISLLGPLDLVAVTDEKALASSVLGKSRDELDTILKSFPTIESANAKVRPFWKSSFPKNLEDIKIERL